MNLSFFLEMAWKSSFIAGIALLLAAILRSRSPADRASVLQVGLALLVLLPLVSLFLPAWQVELAAAAGDVQPIVGTLLQAQEAAPAFYAAAPELAEAPATAAGDWVDPALLVALLYLAGLAVAAARLLGGLATLRRWTAEAETVTCPRWTQALERVAEAAGRTPVPLRVSEHVPSPLSWGWMKPAILIDAESYRRAEDAEAILAHEMAHILRRDWAALMLSRIATALFWFNPLVWLVGRAFIRHAEEAADCRALAQVEPTHYAQALLGCAHHASRAAVPANSIATSDLARRVHSVLEGSARAIPNGSRLCAATILGCLALAGPVSAMKLIPGAAAEAAAALTPVSTRPVPIAPGMVAPAPATPAPVRPVEASGAASRAPAIMAAAAAPQVPVLPAAALRPTVTAASEVRAAALASTTIQSLALASAAGTAAPAQKDERREYEEAMREVQAAGAEAARAGERAARAGQRAGEIARRQARVNMAQGAINMEKGAENMKQGARNMADEAVKLRDPAHRERQIAREAARGRKVTHQELIDAIPQMEKGSRQMLSGAEDMRRGAEQMRRSAQD